MRTDFLFYWSPEETNKYIRLGDTLDYAASKQFPKVGVAIGDQIWIVTSIGTRLYLAGGIMVEALLSYSEASEQLARKDLYFSKGGQYALNQQRGLHRIWKRDITHLVAELGFVDRNGKPAKSIDFERILDPSESKSNLGQVLQAIRRLDANTVVRLTQEIAA